MKITVERYINPHSKNYGGRQEVTFDTSEVQDVRPTKSWWIEKDLVEVIFLNHSFVIEFKEFFQKVKELEAA